MKIRKEEIQKVAEEPIGLFYQGMRALLNPGAVAHVDRLPTSIA